MVASKAITKKKSSPQKVAANRQNAMKSTGPVTKEGKERCSFNAVKHGLFARVLPKERHPFMVDPEEYRTLIALYTADFNPKTEFETTLVESLAFDMMRLRHILQIEVLIWEETRPPEGEAERIHREVERMERRGSVADRQYEVKLLQSLSETLLNGMKPAFDKSDRALLVTMITACHGNATQALAAAGSPEQEQGGDNDTFQQQLARAVVAPVKALATSGTVEDKIRAVITGKERVDADAWAVLLQVMCQNRTSGIARLEELKHKWENLKSKHIQRHIEHFDRLELMNRYETMVRRHIDRTLTQLRTFRQGIEGQGSGSVPQI